MYFQLKKKRKKYITYFNDILLSCLHLSPPCPFLLPVRFLPSSHLQKDETFITEALVGTRFLEKKPPGVEFVLT